ncbi:flagellin : Flagellin domain protein OS=Thermaerobacter marianensis (strain ATCC 700841 / DSM 12885 / JCM 10246 / 7p75a) GN=Tmar_0183 PE=4 SV=1: Flagellin_N: Flagellin_C [Gemmataceae bacterium]|nr:flagellin : Flagellin domain protein OS=Thermaerobacter marianensis (strain ATCC 700841 / DSM 12885 / JCM 10246 / 7p75a) GN=Tmar_0183 PE=4 SV=1: Flagellin_N: Flagellin_C [Gemmataceae bacterium]VTT97934.1 flagellin : Flagellin domain protein OS=Thermaerobacter marianensis (strain ATCC 700841 / DSM 12885 / JCM 10246 / 7p75a) GN=Tmar_0183 PE=4 SV=1: Flagellin_N: Flagellin_C [Gemmataceae bacterium]
MALSIVNNTSSLNAQQSLNKTSGNLSKSLERLSTGLKVNRGADGPAALVISEQQRAQIAGLQTAIDNTNKAVSVVQTGEGALNEVNSLLTKVRGLALDSANSGVNDTNALAANQAEITNALSTIDTIAKNTKFGTKNLLDGSASIAGKVSGANNAGVSAIKTGSQTAPGSYTVTLNTSATGGSVAGTVAGAGTVTSAASLTVAGGGLTGTVGVALDVGDDLSTSIVKVQKALDDATSQGGGKGKFVVDSTAGAIRIRSNILGSAAVSASGNANVEAVTGLTGADTTAAGVALTANVQLNGGTASVITATAGAGGLNNEIKFGGTNGPSFSIDVANGAAAAATSVSTIAVTDNALVFQIGANANETAKISFDSAKSTDLAVGVTGLNNANTTDLSKIDVTSQNGAQDAIKVVDAAISQVSNLRGKLGAFQSNTLESNSRNLSATLQNTVSAESVIRDTDFASEIANFTRLQTQVQAGSTVLGNANQTTQLVAQLLRG